MRRKLALIVAVSALLALSNSATSALVGSWAWEANSLSLGTSGNWRNAVNNSAPEGVTAQAPAIVQRGVELNISPTVAPTVSSGTMTALANPVGGAHTSQGDDSWYRIGVTFPAGHYVPALGAWNFVTAWHQEYYGSMPCPQYVSSGIVVHTDGAVGSPGTNPRLAVLFRSGVVTATATGTTITHHYTIDALRDPSLRPPPSRFDDGGSTGGAPTQPLVLDHPYDLLVHWIWQPDSTGVMEWWVDGVKQVTITGLPTMHVYCDGHTYPDGFGIYNYRRNDITDPSSVYFRYVRIGPTRESVS